MWFYRRLMRIPWTQKTNEEVLSKIMEKRMIVNEIRKRQLRFVGNIKRENGLESMCLEGKIEGSKGRGRPRANFLDGLALASGKNGIQILRSAEDRLVFREMVANVRLWHGTTRRIPNKLAPRPHPTLWCLPMTSQLQPARTPSNPSTIWASSCHHVECKTSNYGCFSVKPNFARATFNASQRSLTILSNLR